MQLHPNELLNWTDPKKFNLDKYFDDSPIGCFLEIDLDFRDELHDLHSDCPLTSGKIKMTIKCCLNIN